LRVREGVRNGSDDAGWFAWRGGSLVKLSDCRPGHRGRVTGFDGDATLTQRLMELGLLEGTEVSVVRASPFRGPLEITFERSTLSLRRAEAEGVEIAS
jgi:ferrous iron transport protein A